MTKKSIFVVCVLLISLTISGCTLFNPTMPVKTPIDLSKAGSVVEAEFWMPTDDRIVLDLCFVIDRPGEGKRLYEKLQHLDKPSLTMQTLKIPLKIQIKKHLSTDKDELWLERIYQTDDLSSTSSKYLDRTIDRLSIKSGSYLIRVENINPFPQFGKNPVEIRIYYSRPPLLW